MDRTAKKKPSVAGFFKSLAREIIIPIILALIVIQYVIQAFQIPSGSMEDTLLTGDFLLGLKFVYGSPVPFSGAKFPAIKNPDRGDVVIFRYPGEPEFPDYNPQRYTHLFNALMFGNFYWDSEPRGGNPHLVHYADGPKDFIKRCVAVSGDTVEVKAGQLYLNGVAQTKLPGHGKYTASFRSGSPRDEFPKTRVPAAGDTIPLEGLPLTDLWRVRSLIVQENPDNKIELELSLKINGRDSPDWIFEDFRVPVEGDRQLLLNEVLSNRRAVGVSLRQGDTISGNVPFRLFTSLARTGFLPAIDPNMHHDGFIRPVSYYAFEGSQLGDLEANVARLNAIEKLIADTTAKDLPDSLVTFENETANYELSWRLLFDGSPFDEYVVKANTYFMMGDNRDNSADSRYWGFVAQRSVKAKAFIIYFSFENADGKFSFGNPFSWWRIPFKIRWTRFGKVVHLIGE